MPKKNIKLGMDMSDGLIDMPRETKKHYPTFFVEAGEPLDLPHTGTMTIRYKKVSRSEHEDSDGDTKYSCTIEVHEIIDAYSDEPEAPAKSHSRETENALDELRTKRKRTY